MLGYNDAFAKLHPVLRQWRAKAAADRGSAAPVPYIVSADVSRAFDHVSVEKLIDIVDPLLHSQEYLIIKHVEVGTRCISAAHPPQGFVCASRFARHTPIAVQQQALVCTQPFRNVRAGTYLHGPQEPLGSSGHS